MKCFLCLQEKKLIKSHIIPEFCFKPLYDEKHKYYNLSTSEKDNNFSKQSGIWERLLCLECDQYLGRFETYAAKLITENIYKASFYCENPISIYGVDYKKFKIFQLSILWRVSISKKPFYSGVNLGPHENKIREMIINENPGKPHEYGCHLQAFIEKGKVVSGLISRPESLRIEGFNVCRLIMCGCLWGFVISNRSEYFKGHELFLNKSGHLVLPWVIAKETELLSTLAKELSAAGKLTI